MLYLHTVISFVMLKERKIMSMPTHVGILEVNFNPVVASFLRFVLLKLSVCDSGLITYWARTMFESVPTY